MESSKSSGVTEEFQGSESGWTMYFESSIHDYDYGDDDEDGDSVVSDASSGPFQQEKKCGESEKVEKILEEKKQESVESVVRKNTCIGKRN